ncbi:sodium/hydrogen exchanger family domain-containing protein [Ditylenchus destructor]|nr:sodium/hydrogen exchanger family domain-containing protein [Ditylenchus destructor]
MSNVTLPPHHRTHYVSTEGGIFSGKSLLNSPLALFLVQATIIITLSRLIHGVLYKFRQPRVIAEILGGICLGPSILGNIPHFTETLFPQHSLPMLSLISSFGLVLYMFLMGLELDTGILLKGIKKFTVISLAGIMLPGALGALVSYGLYEFLLDADKREVTPFSSFLLFTFVALAITAFPVLARILTEKKLLSTNVGMMTISAAAIDDICAWVLLALTISIINAGDPFTAVYVLATIAAYAVLLLVPGRILLKMAFDKFLSTGNRILTQFVLSLIFGMVFLSAWTTEWIGVHAIFGAFLVGIIIPRVGGITMELTQKLEDVVSIAFLPLYFASSGLKTKMGLLNDWITVFFCVAVIVVACAGKIIGCTVAARWTGFPWRESLSIGVLMNTKGLVELIVLNIGLDAGVINDRIFVVMVVMALVTTFMTSPIIAYIYPPKFQSRPVSMKKRIGSLSTMKMAESHDERILLYLQNIDSITHAANIVQMFRLSLTPGKQMFLNGFKAFTDLDRSSNIMVSTQTERVIENDPTLRMFKFFGKLIGSWTQCFVAATNLQEIGMELDRVAAKQQCDVIIVPWQKEASGSDQRDVAISILNDVSHNTVAIFVDRRPTGTGCLLSHAPFSNIVLPFVGTGTANDRAALHLALRLRKSANKDIPLTLIHLHIAHNKLDSPFLQAAKNLAEEESGDVAFHAIKCTSPTGFKAALEKSLKGNTAETHDLVILGHMTMPVLLLNNKQNNGKAEEGNPVTVQPKSPTSAVGLVRRFSQAAGFTTNLTDDERVFGSIGELIYNMDGGGPSLMIIHELNDHKNSAA